MERRNQLVVDDTLLSKLLTYQAYQTTQAAFWNLYFQVHNQKFFKAREVPWNKRTSINISFTTNKRKAPQRNILEFFLLDTFKAALEIGNINHGWTQSGHFFPKSGNLFSMFKKVQGTPPSLPWLVASLILVATKTCAGVTF